MNRIFKAGLVALGLLLLVPSTVKAESLRGRYFVVVFGYEGPGNRPVDSHTFAAFYDGDAVARRDVSSPATISWLPATGVVRPLRREPGRNFSLQATINLQRRNGYAIRAWGPYEITVDLYRRALDRIALLESGRVQYKMINGPLSGGAVNCINALGDIFGDINTGVARGFSASALVTRHFGPAILASRPDLTPLIGLDRILRGR